MNRSKLIILATYWNEIEWINASLSQILKLNPIEVVLCDGNFDPRFPNYSTDGTSQIIENFVKNAPFKCTKINAIRRANNFLSLPKINLFRCKNNRQFFSVGSIKNSLYSKFVFNSYRVNQALTFAYMSKLCNHWNSSNWFMTLDADQFYTDNLIENIYTLLNDNPNEYQLMTAKELTFPFDFFHYTTKYEQRTWNNMPHKIIDNISFYPTRHPMIENLFLSKTYQNNVKSIHLGEYHHYKFRSSLSRLNAGYSLGDRQPPSPERYNDLINYVGAYPNSILENFEINFHE